MKIPVPHTRKCWLLLGLVAALLAAFIVSLVVWTQQGKPGAVHCYAAGTFDGLTIYLASNKTTMQSCNSAATGSGLTNLSSLPPGVTEVCTNATVTVYMKPQQVATVRSLGLNPATICS
jgi:hypothetical protein